MSRSLARSLDPELMINDQAYGVVPPGMGAARPETALALTNPMAAARLMVLQSRDKLYALAKASADSVAKTYLSVASPKTVDDLTGIDGSFDLTKGLLGGDRGFTFNLNIRKKERWKEC